MQTRVNQEHGSNCGAVGKPQAPPCSETTFRRSRSALARYASRAERCSLGFAHGCSLARPAGPLSSLSNLPSALSAVAARRYAGPTLARARRRPAGTRQTGSVGNLHRRQLQFGEKRGAAVGPTRRGKGSKIMAIADRHGLPVAVHVVSASPNEATLVEPTLERRFLRETPERLIGDKAYDSAGLDQRVREHLGVELIAPHRWNRSRPIPQDGRALRRYRRRWKIERLFAWFHHYRRIVIRWEYGPENFLGMVQLACAVILLRHL